jgi:hypothetical protein
MDLILASSEHAKKVFESTEYQRIDQNTKQNLGNLKLTTPVEVLFEGIRLDMFSKEYTKEPNIENLFKDIKIYKVKNSWELERKMDSLPGSDEEIKLSNNINDIKKILLKYNNNNRSLYVNIVRHFSHKGKRELEFYNNVLKDKEFGYQFVEPIVQNMKNSKYPDKIIDIIVKNGYQNHDKFVEYIYSLPIDNPLFEYILFSQPQIRMNVSKTIKFFIKNKLDLDFFYTYFDPKNYRLPVYDIINLIDYANDDKKMFTFLLPTIKNLRDKSDIINVALSLKDINLRNFLINTEIKNK